MGEAGKGHTVGGPLEGTPGVGGSVSPSYLVHADVAVTGNLPALGLIRAGSRIWVLPEGSIVAGLVSFFFFLRRDPPR